MARVYDDEESARWIAPRPRYMREAEPGTPAAWPSVDPAYLVDPEEQILNRQLFTQGRNRKSVTSSGKPADGEDQQQRKAG
jgi:hypothetical protein